MISTVLAAGSALHAQGVGTTQQFGTEDLCLLLDSRSQTASLASTDPDDRSTAPDGGNDDGFSGANGCEAYRELDQGTPVSVLAHWEGRKGVLGLFFRNFWSDAYGLPMLPGENNRTRIWLDGSTVHDMPLANYFRNSNADPGQIAPFAGPFTGHRSGAHVTHAQMVWKDSFKIALDDDQFANAARFHRVAVTLASPEGDLLMPDMAVWEAVAANPGQWPHQAERVPQQVLLSIAANQRSQPILVPGPATLLEVTCQVSDPAMWSDLWARFSWDGAATPQVEVPLRHLGGMVEAPASFAVDSLLLANDGSRKLSCWFPMPFGESARLQIENRGSNPATVQVTYCTKPGVPEASWGYFVAQNSREITGTGEPFLGPRLTDCQGMLRALILEDFADTSGRIEDMHMSHLEGDLCVRINGNRGDDHTFAASETSIGRWGWYLTPADSPFVSDTSFQSSLMARFLPNNHTEGRRIMGSTYLFDPIHFVDGIEVLLEHGVQNTSNADYSLSSFLYVQPGTARETIAEIDIGNVSATHPHAEPAHEVEFVAWNTYVRHGGFLRDQFFGTQAVTETVRSIRDYLRFEVRPGAETATNHGYAIGLRLDRLGGSSMGVCQADVLVDGEYAGLLHVCTHNEVFPWKEGGECEVQLPRALTDNKTHFTVQLEPRTGPGIDDLNIARIKVYSYLK